MTEQGGPMSAGAAVDQAVVGGARAPWKAAVAPYAKPRLARDAARRRVVRIAVPGAADRHVSAPRRLGRGSPCARAIGRRFPAAHVRRVSRLHTRLAVETKRANRRLGTVLGLVMYTPFESWAHSHAVHHATAGDLDRRGIGDDSTLTVAEYNARAPSGLLASRLFRHPLVMFGLGPLLSVVIMPRLVPKNTRPRLRRSIIRTNIAVAVIVVGLCLLMGWWQYLIVQWPVAWLASSAGIFVFYVQHQFEDVYWENSDNWDYADAAIRGSSFVTLPPLLRYFTGNIGYHHVH